MRRLALLAALACASDAVLADDRAYDYGALFEPPTGRVLHGMGPWEEGNARYLDVLSESGLAPGSALGYVWIGDQERPWLSRREKVYAFLEAEVAAGRIPHLGVEFRDRNLRDADERYYGVDDVFADTDRLDQIAIDIARMIASLASPVFVRVGEEFNGSWKGYHPDSYPRAYRKLVRLFRENGADNAAFVWAYEPAAPPDFDARDDGEWRWYPGDDVVDWFAIDTFDAQDFSGPLTRSGRPTRHGRTIRFLNMAHEHGKPVMIAASSPVKVGITPSEADGRRAWENWFEPYFAFLREHPSVKAFYYVNNDWRKIPLGWEKGRQADLTVNRWLVERYLDELRDPRYLHADELELLRGWRQATRREVIPLPARDSDEARRARRDAGRRR